MVFRVTFRGGTAKSIKEYIDGYTLLYMYIHTYSHTYAPAGTITL